MQLVTTSEALVTTSKALVTSSDAPVTTSFLLLLAYFEHVEGFPLSPGPTNTWRV